MKKILSILLLAAGAAARAHAAVTVGSDVGYLFDSKEAYSTGRVGVVLLHTPAGSHTIEAEVGYTESRVAGGDASLLPVTLNYRFTGDVSGAWGYSAGVGAGFARTSVDGVSTGGAVRLRDESIALQSFAQVEYRLTPLAAVTAGLRYLWVDDITLAGSRFAPGDDVAASLGLRISF